MNDPSTVALKDWSRNSAETLGTLMGQGARPKDASSFVVTPSEVGSSFPEGGFTLLLSLSAALTGPALLAIELGHAKILATSMLGEEAPPESFSPLHEEILGEAVKQMAGFLEPALTRAMGHEVSVHGGETSCGAIPDIGAPLYVVLEFPIHLSEAGEIVLSLLLPAGLAEELSAAAAENGFHTPAPESPEETPNGGSPALPGAAQEPSSPNHQAQLREANFGPVSKPAAANLVAPMPTSGGLDIILDVPLEVMAVLGKTSLMIEELLSIGEGSVLELDKLAGEPIELFVKDRLVALGEVVVIDERFGVKILEVSSGRRPTQPSLASGL